jgi:hypothetical protein
MSAATAARIAWRKEAGVIPIVFADEKAMTMN